MLYLPTNDIADQGLRISTKIWSLMTISIPHPCRPRTLLSLVIFAILVTCRNLNFRSGLRPCCCRTSCIYTGNELLQHLLKLGKCHWLGYKWVHSMWITIWHIVCQCIGCHLFQQSKCYTSPILQVILSSLQASKAALPNRIIQMSSALALSMIVQFTDSFGWSMAISFPSYQVGN